MNRLFTIFLTSLFVVHAAFGCCIHHAHACHVGCIKASSNGVEECPCHDHEEDRDSTRLGTIDVDDAKHFGDKQQPQHGPQRCHGEKCNFARTEASVDEGCLQTYAKLAVLARLTPFFASEFDFSITAPGSNLRAMLGVPRLHLLLAVLLI